MILTYLLKVVSIKSIHNPSLECDILDKVLTKIYEIHDLTSVFCSGQGI